MAKKGKRLKSKKAFRVKLKPQTVYSIAQIIFFSFVGLIIISFSRQGLILVKLNDFLMNYFSWTTIFLPFIFLSMGLLISKYRIPLSQPNVFVGILLFFVSIMTVSRAGTIGETAWSGMATMVTGVGAFIILVGTSIVGLIILFNTSLQQVAQIIVQAYKTVRGYIFGVQGQPKLARKQLKISGGSISTQSQSSPKLSPHTPSETLEPKLVSNVPGEEKIWKYPDISVLSDTETGKADRGDIKGNADSIEQTLESFGINAKVVEVNLGPAVTQYALEVALGTKLSKITTLERDLALALAAPTGTIRIEAPIPGKSLVGIELPNKSPEFVPLRKMLEADVMKDNPSKLEVALGLDVSGKPIVADLGRMPHVLIAGQTGSGKSVCINTFLSTLLFRSAPSEVKLILVDPKRVELTGYNQIPHLLTPVIIEPNKVISSLRWILTEMDRRYKLFSQAGVRNIEGYNEMSGFQALPYIILFIDEFGGYYALFPG